MELSTIIGPKEKRRRDLAVKEAKRREEGIRPQEEYNQERKQKAMTKAEMIRELLEMTPNLTVRQIAEETGIPRSTVSRLRKTI